MRIRTMKPSIRSDETVCSWDFPVRWTFAGLFNYCDDDGRGRDDVRLLKADLYPIDDRITKRVIAKHLAIIADSGPLCRYSVEGKNYLHLVNWEHQRINRPTASLLPPCPIHDKELSDHPPLTEPAVSKHTTKQSASSVNSHGAVTEDSPGERKGREGKGKEGKKHIAPATPTRARDELFDALIAACGWDANELTTSARGSTNQALKQLREVGATPNQVTVRARRFTNRYENIKLTPAALAKHWAALTGTNPDTSPSERDQPPPMWPGYDPLRDLENRHE